MDTSLTRPMEACMRSFGTEIKRNYKRTDTIWSVFRTRKFNRFRNNWYSYAIVEVIKKCWKIHVFSANSSPLWVNLRAIMRFRQPSWRWQKCVPRNPFNANGFNYCWAPKCAKLMRMLHNDFCFLKCVFHHNSMTPAIEIVRPSFVMKEKKKKNRNSFMDRYSSHHKNAQKQTWYDWVAKKTTTDQTVTNARRKIARKKIKSDFFFVPFATDRNILCAKKAHGIHFVRSLSFCYCFIVCVSVDLLLLFFFLHHSGYAFAVFAVYSLRSQIRQRCKSGLLRFLLLTFFIANLNDRRKKVVE